MKLHPLIGVWVCWILGFSTYATTYTLTVNGATKQGAVPHFWSRCVGTGGAQLCTDTSWKNAAKIGVAEAGFQAFRGHRILSASNPISWNGSGTPTYNWTAFDKIYDVLVDTLHTTPVFELSSMPNDLQTSGEWSPPKSFPIWQDLIHQLVLHCISRYGLQTVRTWLFEVWNEWNYGGFWSNGTEAQYYQLYQSAVAGAKSADSLIQIGGPATTSSGQLQAFVNYCTSNNVKYDFITNHDYGGGGSGPSADPVNIRNDNRTRASVVKSSGKKLLSLNTEYNSSYSGQGGNTGANCISMDSHVNAPFIAKCVKLILDDNTAGTYVAPDVLSYWTISDDFDEGSFITGHNLVPFGEVFGLINYQGIRKAAFNSYKMLNMMGTTRLSLTGGTGDPDGVDGFATLSSDNSQVAVMVYNFYVTLGGQTLSDDVNLTINSLPLPQGQITVNHYRIDSLHSNAYAVWLKQGKPSKPSTAQWNEMRDSSNLAQMYPMKTISYTGGAYTESFTLPRQGMSLLVFKSNSVSTLKGAALSPMKSVSPLMITGTTLHSSGDFNGPIVATIHRLDGKEVKRLSVSRNGSDLRQLLPKGIYLVSVEANSARIIGKVVIDR